MFLILRRVKSNNSNPMNRNPIEAFAIPLRGQPSDHPDRQADAEKARGPSWTCGPSAEGNLLHAIPNRKSG